MREYPKSVMKLIRQYARNAHEEELRRALEPLARPITRLEPIPLRSFEGVIFTCPERDGSAAAPFGK